MRRAGPVFSTVVAIFAIWYIMCLPMNIHSAVTSAERAGLEVTPEGAQERVYYGGWSLVLKNPIPANDVWSQSRARLPAPHQVAAELWRSTVVEELTGRRGIVNSGSLSNRGLLHHAIVTLSATLTGFVFGTLLGVVLAVGIVRYRVMDMSVMPWAIISQTIPIVALAPMVIVVLSSIGLQGLIPKAVISAYLSFFPVVVGMVKGLRAPDRMQLDLLHTYNARWSEGLFKLRLPASAPYLFTSLKIAIAASLVGAIVGELPVQRGGLGARMLAGTYYGQTEQIWAALLMAAALAAALVALISAAERRTLRKMGVEQ
ncbi:MAG: ABC transporter permease [Rhodobacteraceae bacterium]|nr:ABC transporter permease [Paracoccaceae bacterium]